MPAAPDWRLRAPRLASLHLAAFLRVKYRKELNLDSSKDKRKETWESVDRSVGRIVSRLAGWLVQIVKIYTYHGIRRFRQPREKLSAECRVLAGDQKKQNICISIVTELPELLPSVRRAAQGYIDLRTRRNLSNCRDWFV